VTRIDQFLPGFAPHDAIGSNVLQIRRVLQEAGIASDIWAEDIHAPMHAHARPYREYGGAPRADALLYHASTGSEMVNFLQERPELLLIEYHNITPAGYFARWEPVAAAAMTDARRQLLRLATQVDLGLAVSSFNETELVELGYHPTAVVPLLVDFDDYDAAPSARTLARLERSRARGGARWLFVGRVAPNKCQHDVIGALAAYRHVFDPKATLTLVGGTTSRLYFRSLEKLAAELGVRDAVEFTDSVSFGDLLAHYRTADVFVCLSEHEGVGVPLLEAMHFGVPVVAGAAAALPETVGDAGILLPDKDPAVVACAVNRVLTDAELRGSLLEAGRARVEEYSLARTGKRFLDTVVPAVAGSSGAHG
jgi:glycosyltransferase involved in cell wall biosynthesis